ncbi:RpnC/YadD family protein [Frigoriglobus tundricola]|uniref:Transposase n=1 Tax=Frigoriglobus tundricola TaxID=2774151 RepID=A0A6M5YW88_9BACT|nr:cytosolic protein [Frigoriglobus tundricola]QJW98209.1 hypothetical protein FTUN_5790 [Frigoriglobus tundricola]
MDELASEFDTAWKEALEWFFEPFLAFFFPNVYGTIDWNRSYEFMDKELQQVVPEAATGRGTVDKLVKVWTAAGHETWVLVHIEVQSQHDPAFAERMYTYNHRLRDRYGRMPVSLAVLGDESRSWRPDTHREGQWGCEVRFTFPTVKLVDYTGRDAVLEADTNPFAAVTLAHLKAQETKSDPVTRYDWKMRLVKGLYDRGFDRVRVVRLFRLIDWVIKLPKVQRRLFSQEIEAFERERQMPLLSPTEQMWQEDGIAIGMARGIYAGIEVALDIRFGAEGLALVPQIRHITDPVVLEQLLRASKSVSDLGAFRAMLPPQPQA